jgi:triacylglycerol lipase
LPGAVRAITWDALAERLVIEVSSLYNTISVSTPADSEALQVLGQAPNFRGGGLVLSELQFMIWFLVMAAGSLALLAPGRGEHVILIHGLCRSPASLRRLERTLLGSGYTTHNLRYPSRSKCISELSDDYVASAITECNAQGAARIHFVGHSMGAILIRHYLSRNQLPNLGRVVMLAPPNSGSEVVDRLRDNRLFRWINGPAGQELGTDPSSLPNRLGRVHYPVGIIAGDRSINWINSLFMIPGSDDGKVSVERTRLAGMTDHVVVHVAHPFIMNNPQCIEHVLGFLRQGKFHAS